MNTIVHPKHVRGRLRINQVFQKIGNAWLKPGAHYLPDQNELWVPIGDWQDNLVVYEWGAIVSRLLGSGEIRYRLGGLYLEYENVSTPGDPVAVPVFGRDRDIEYYNNLAGSATRDYLRVPMIAHALDSSDAALFPKQNQVRFFSRSSGLTGVHGKPFGHASNSVLFGAALVAYVDPSDATQDLIFSVHYFEPEVQQPKLATSQLGLEWELTME